MDKYEYKVHLDEMNALLAEHDYARAMEICNTIDWKKVKNTSTLCTVSEIYKINRQYEDARDILLMAYDRYPSGKAIIYALCELAIKLGEVVQAVNYYNEYSKIAPKDPARILLHYKILEAQDATLEERALLLEEYKDKDYREKWAYELAYLYHRMGQATKCVEECDELILWFGEGSYVLKAMELKMLHKPLTSLQQEKYDRMMNIDEDEEFFNEQASQYGEEYADDTYADDGYSQNAYAEEGYSEDVYPQDAYVQEGYAQESYAEEAYPEEQYAEGEYVQNDNYAKLYGDQYANEYYEDHGISRDKTQRIPFIPDEEGIIPTTADEDSIEVKPLNVDKYSTLNLQEELSRSMQELFEGDNSMVTLSPADEVPAFEEPSETAEYAEDSEYIEEGEYAEDSEYVEEGEYAEDSEYVEEGEYAEDSEYVEEGEYAEDSEYVEEGEYAEDSEYVEEGEYAGDSEYVEEGEYAEDSEYVEEGEYAEDSEYVEEGEYAENSEYIEDSAYVEESAEEEDLPIEIKEPEFVPQVNTISGYEEISRISEGFEPENGFADKESEPAAEPEIVRFTPKSTLRELPKETEAPVHMSSVKLEPETDFVKPGTKEESSMNKILSQEYDGQISMVLPEQDAVEKQITGQIDLEDYLVEAEQTRRENQKTRISTARRKDLEQTNSISLDIDEEVQAVVLDVQEEQPEIEEDENTSSEDLYTQEIDLDKEYLEDVQTAQEYEQDNFDTSQLPVDELATGQLPDVSDMYNEEYSAEGQYEEDVYPEDMQPYEEEAYPEDVQPYEEEAYPEDVQPYEEEAYPEDVQPYEEEAYPEDMQPYEEDVYPEGMQPYEEEAYPEDVQPYEEEAYPEDVQSYEEEAYPEDIDSYDDYPEDIDDDYDADLEEIFGSFLGMKKMKEAIQESLAASGMDPRTGNIIITGNERSVRHKLAASIAKYYQRTEYDFTGKVAKISADDLNSKDIRKAVNVLCNGALIVENAGRLTVNTLDTLAKSINHESMKMLIILEDEKHEIRKLSSLRSYFDKMFDIRIDIPTYSNDDLVEHAKEYALEREYTIDEFGVLALYSRIDELQTSEHFVTIAEVEEIMDKAIENVNKKNFSHFKDVLFSKRYDENDLIIIREKDFMTRK